MRITFGGAAFVRVHWHDDTTGVECLGYGPPNSTFETWPVLDTWTIGDFCPDPLFYRVIDSAWTPTLPSGFTRHSHFVVDGRDGCIELVAECYTWCEWQWPPGSTVDAAIANAPIATGQYGG
ncbi:hypothetical protein [Rubripirellula obstinata]|uniref:hypothetical protein n=1 Tax=Rubripirellula obstinata TaxID=406547 RepID=UPI00082DA8F8|nr:hypothetical protein [Rubripirellula obstinata]